MSKCKRKEEGITVLALIITIIVLVILVAVMIKVLKDHKLVEVTFNVTQKYEIKTYEEQIEEEKVYSKIEEIIEKLRQNTQ